MHATTLDLWPDQRDRAVRLAKRPGAVRMEGPCRARVASFGAPGRTHAVAQAGEAWLCDCDFYIATGQQCGHAVAVRYVLAVGPDMVMGTVTLTAKSPQALYDYAIAREVHLFDALLSDLCSTIPEPPYAGNGRPSVPLREQAFCAVQKVYSQLSCRRAKSLFDKAAERGEIAKAPSFVTTSRFLNRDDATAILTDLIHQSAAPLANLESSFAVDATGIRITNFTPYCQDKHGGKKKHAYLKAHAICGVKTNIVTSVRVTGNGGAGSADSPNFEPLVEATARTFRLREVSADKAYSGKFNLWMVKQAGGEALIPFKEGRNAPGDIGPRASSKQSVPRAPGSGAIWSKAFHYFQAHRDEFDARYHKRSNVEATFSAIKRKFGDSVKSRNEVAQRNEVLAKVLAYNLTVLIKASFSLGIDLSVFQKSGRVGV